MPNTNQPFGMRPAYHLGGGVVRADALVGGITSAFAQSIYRGDPVILTADGVINPAAAGERLYGVFWGVQYNDSNGRPTYSSIWVNATVATNVIAYVYRDPNIVYEIQCNTNFSVADIGANCDILYTSGTTIAGGFSRVEAVSDFAASTRQLNVVDMVRRANNESGTNSKILVRINEHQWVSESNTGI